MAVKLKANIAYGSHLESVSRKFVPRKETCSSVATKIGPTFLDASGWMGGGVRHTYRAGLGYCERNYVVMRVNARSTAPTANELQQRENFAAVIAGRQAILADLTQIGRVQTMWKGGKVGSTYYEGAMNDMSITVNGVSAKGYTFKGWLFAVQHAGLTNNPSYNVNQFPADYDA